MGAVSGIRLALGVSYTIQVIYKFNQFALRKCLKSINIFRIVKEFVKLARKLSRPPVQVVETL